MTKVRGFTLIELMVVLIVGTVLTAVAFNAYSKQVRKSHRYDAVTGISNLHTREQRWRASHATYSAFAAENSTGGYYLLTTETPPATGACGVGTKSSFNSYRITATPTSKDNQAADTGCATLVLTNLCGVITKTSTGGDTCWPD